MKLQPGGLLNLLLSVLLHSLLPVRLTLGASLSVQDEVPPSETRGVRANEEMVVFVVMVGTGPERQEVVQGPRELVPRVGVHSLEQSQANPKRDGEQMQVSGEVAPDNGDTDSAQA